MDEYGDVLSELEHRDFYTAESRAEAVLFGLGFTDSDLHRDVAEFSGGIRMRIALAKLLLDQPEFMMLDEPTNHLDIEARNWLEDYLSSYAGGIIVVSHDRYFLDRITRQTVEVSRGRLTEYIGGYSRYLVQREERFRGSKCRPTKSSARKSSTWRRSSAASATRRAKPSWCSRASSSSKKSCASNRLPEAKSRPRLIFPIASAVRGGSSSLKARSRNMATLTVYDGVDLVIERGSRIALVGPNGAGKSTMMKMLAGIEPMTAGERSVGGNVAIGYFAQNLADTLDYTKTVYDELSDATER